MEDEEGLVNVGTNVPGVKLISLDGADKLEEIYRSKVLWIPLNPSENIEDYHTLFEPQGKTEKDEQKGFLRAAEISEPLMLNQEKMRKSRLSQSPISITSQYSSSSKLSLLAGAPQIVCPGCQCKVLQENGK